MNTTEAADLARIILADSEPDRPMDLYTLNVHEARTLARAVARVEALADGYDAEARLEMREGDVTDSINTQATADRIRAALKGDDA